MEKPRSQRSAKEHSGLGPLDEPGAPGSVPFPDHDIDIPAAPSTHPPEPPIVPSDSAIGEFISSYGPALILIAAGLVIALLVLATFDV